MEDIERLCAQKAEIMDQIASLTRDADEIQHCLEVCLDCLEQVKAEVQEARSELQTESEQENLMKFD